MKSQLRGEAVCFDSVVTRNQSYRKAYMDETTEEESEELISVVIPTYNRVGVLRRAVDSVLNQTYKKIEIVIVDDGSTDGTFDKVQEWYGELDNLIYVINDMNMGPSGSRNTGVNYAHGKYIAFQDSDDEWRCDKLEKQMKLMEQKKDVCGMVYCCLQRDWNNGYIDVWPPKEVSIGSKSGNVYRTVLLGPLIATPSMLIRKDCFQQIHGFNNNLKSLEDYEFTIRFARQYDIYLVDETLVESHELADSVEKNYKERIHTQLYILNRYKNDMKLLGIKKHKLMKVYQQAVNDGLEEIFMQQFRRIKPDSDDINSLYEIKAENCR